MDNSTPQKPSIVGTWWLLGVGILSLVLSQVVRIFFANMVVYNPGLAFGIAAPDWLIVPVVIIFLIVILVWYCRNQKQDVYTASAFGMILGGGTSNLIERFLFDGRVADYWNLFGISTINLADIFVGLGIILIIVKILHSGR